MEKTKQVKSALATQVGGNHYEMAIQPAEFAMVESYDWCCANILKYVTRAKHKNGRQDIEKAMHYLALRAEIIRKHDLDRFLRGVRSLFNSFGRTWATDVPMPDSKKHEAIEVYIAANGIAGRTAHALWPLDCVAKGVGGSHSSDLQRRLQALLDEYDEPCARGLLDHEWVPHSDFHGKQIGRVCQLCGENG